MNSLSLIIQQIYMVRFHFFTPFYQLCFLVKIVNCKSKVYEILINYFLYRQDGFVRITLKIVFNKNNFFDFIFF